jgi:hypothetical protein
MARRFMAVLAVVGLLGTAGCGGGPARGGASAQPSARASASPPPASIDGPVVLKTSNSFDVHQLGISDIHPLDPNQAYVITPHSNIGLDAVLTTTTLDQRQINAMGLNSRPAAPPVYGPLKAPPGHEYLLTHVSGGPQGLADRQSGSTPLFSIRIGDQVTTAPVNDVAATLIVVPVPVGTDAFLVVEDADRTWTISLRTGKRGEATPSYRSMRDFGKLETLIQVDRYGQIPLSLGLGATLTPYVEGRGWAASGHAWLKIEPKADVISSDIDLHLDLPASFDVHPPNGNPSTLPAGSLDTAKGSVLSSAAGEYYFDVPDNLRSLRYTIKLAMTVTASSDNAKLNWHALRSSSSAGTLTLK